MKIDGAILVANPSEAGPAAHRLEELGYDGGFSFEGPHDPFFPLVRGRRARPSGIELSTAIAIAFARTPMTARQHRLGSPGVHSKGRFILGLGSQIRPHIERRFSMEWSRPAARMRELVQALRAIWDAWQGGGRLDFRGEFYQHTLMTPVFDPGPNPHGPPRVFLAAVGPKMTEVAGEVADGLFVHPFHTPEYVESITLPALERGLARAGRSRDSLEISCQLIVASGSNDEELENAKRAAKAQISFYASTPAYRPVLEQHGLGELQTELNRLSKRGSWLEMAARVDDALLERIAVVGPTDEVPDRLRARCEGFADRVSLVSPTTPEPERWAHVVRALHG